jgi:hypothetical protein
LTSRIDPFRCGFGSLNASEEFRRFVRPVWHLDDSNAIVEYGHWTPMDKRDSASSALTKAVAEKVPAHIHLVSSWARLRSWFEVSSNAGSGSGSIGRSRTPTRRVVA